MPSSLARLFLCVSFLLTSLPPTFAAGDAEHGKYLVMEVAKCGDCHTPIGPTGPDTEKWLKGTILPFGPLQPMKEWQPVAPDLTSSGRLFQKWGAAGLTRFLETGLGPSGRAAGPPMPAYKMKAADARDITAYLKTLQ